jgi:hypothetical protein
MRISSSRNPPKIVIHKSPEKLSHRIAVKTGGNPIIHCPPLGRNIIASRIEFGNRSRQAVTINIAINQIIKDVQQTVMKNMKFRKTSRIKVGIEGLIVVYDSQL